MPGLQGCRQPMEDGARFVSAGTLLNPGGDKKDERELLIFSDSIELAEYPSAYKKEIYH